MREDQKPRNRREMFKDLAALSTVGAGAALLSSCGKDESGIAESVDTDYVELPPENAKTFTTTCQYCKVQCGYKVKVWEQGTGRKPAGSYAAALSGDWVSPAFVASAEQEGKPVYIAIIPDKDCVVNKGDYSVRGGTMAQTLFAKGRPSAEKRLTQPMIRKGGKNSPLTPVSWDEAIDFTVENIKRIRDEHGPDALGMAWGDWLFSLPTHAMLKLWFEGLGSSSYMGNGWCFNEESAGISHALGSGTRSFTVEDFELTELMVSAGTNQLSNGSVWYHRFHYNNVDAKQIVIDPYRTTQARHAEERGGLHLKIVPGTDAILATAIMQEIIRQDGYDKEYVGRYVRGFDVLLKVAAMPQFSLENAAKTTGIPAEKIKAAADMMMAHKGKTMILHEKGILHQMAAFEHQFAFTALGVILGNLGKPGATSSRAGGHPGGVWYWPPEPASREHNKDLLKALREGKIKLLWTLATNVLKQITNLNVHKPLIESTFFIVQDRIRTEMNDAADVVFPAATWGEINGVASTEDRRLRLQQKFMDPPGEARPDWEILADVAKKLGCEGFDWKSDEEVWDEIRSKCPDIQDIDWNMLREAGTDGVKWPRAGGKGIVRLFSDQAEELLGKRFYTEDDKIHLEEMELVGKLDLDTFEWGEVNEDYPLMAFDFRINGLWNSGYTYWDSDEVSQRVSDAFVLVHPEDAQKRGIKDGAMVTIRSAQGECKAVARVTTDVIQGNVGVTALFPKEGQEFNYVTRSEISPINGEADTMVAVDVAPG